MAIVSFDGAIVDYNQLKKMAKAIQHRGPDSSGIWYDKNVGFGFQRLSILDLTDAADQPMTSPDGRYTIVFNGEIYNFVELRSELECLGYCFCTSGDTEVLLCAYIQWGVDCLLKLNGMWSFLVYDKLKKTLFGSRDRFGIKPLFIYRCNTKILFGSEIKSIRVHPDYGGGVDWSISAEFLLQERLDFNQRTFFAGIEKIPPGTAFSVDRFGKLKSWNYWELPSGDLSNSSDLVEEYFSLFSDSVRLRMRSDVPVGVFLSGGLDSTSIICEMARLSEENGLSSPISAFSFVHGELDESEYIKDTVAQVKADLRLCTTDPLKLWNTLSLTLWHHDEPVHSMNALIGFELSRMAAESGIKVVLNGQGADESTAGYFSYFLNYWYSLFYNLSVREAWSEIRAFTSAFGGSQLGLFTDTLLKALWTQIACSHTYQKIKLQRQYRRHMANNWFEPEFKSNLLKGTPQRLDLSLDSQLRQSITNWPLPLYLRIEDRNTMAHGVEARLPFLDYRLISFLFSVKNDLKMRGCYNKYILRAAMEHRIPPAVRLRKDKMGFPVPSQMWFTTSLFETAKQVLSDKSTRERGFWKTDKILSDLINHRNGTTDISLPLFYVLQFELWMRMMIDDGQQSRPSE
ncbi:asparagine synthase (glutamine-hydrolyzing) [Bythopirellula goksoeyrii]|uniref:asparagine synthase (glutamine-hydrolyzing) n=1 Tax=Bythopirellula goksoeyrii TaxID=1400387 RepID=UPI001AF02815|nr:asparagine synthase (glutamine-hydrolyzing) [Bythopirellula goksoeyrii]